MTILHYLLQVISNCVELNILLYAWKSTGRFCGRELMSFLKYSEWIQFQCHSTDAKYSEWIYFRVVKASYCWRYICQTVKFKCVLCCREYSDCSNWPHQLLLCCKNWHPSAAQCVLPVSRYPADREHCFQQPAPCTHRIGTLLACLVRTTLWCISVIVNAPIFKTIWYFFISLIVCNFLNMYEAKNKV